MFKPNQFIVFRAPATPTEKGERFRVVEMRGDRVLVADADTYWKNSPVSPTAVYPAVDMVDELEAMIARIKSEVIQLIQAGTVPTTCASFSELHDYCDANMLGGGEDIDVESREWADFCEQLNLAQNTVDAWLKAGGHNRPAPDYSGLRPDIAKAATYRATQMWCYVTTDGRTFYVTEDQANKMQERSGGTVYPPETK